MPDKRLETLCRNTIEEMTMSDKQQKAVLSLINAVAVAGGVEYGHAQELSANVYESWLGWDVGNMTFSMMKK